MFRLLRFIPVALPFVMRFLRSPRGQALIAKVRGRGGDPGTGTGSTGTHRR